MTRKAVASGMVAAVTLAGGIAIATTDPALACASAKLRATGGLNRALTGCFARDPATLDACCFSKAMRRFLAAFEHAEAAGGCSTTGDATTIGTTAVNAANQLVASYVPGCAVQITFENSMPSCVTGTPPASCGGACTLFHGDTFRCSPVYFCACM